MSATFACSLPPRLAWAFAGAVAPSGHWRVRALPLPSGTSGSNATHKRAKDLDEWRRHLLREFGWAWPLRSGEELGLIHVALARQGQGNAVVELGHGLGDLSSNSGLCEVRESGGEELQ